MKQLCFFGLLFWVVGFIPYRIAYAQTTTARPDSLPPKEKTAKKSRLLFAADSVKTFTLTTDWRPLLKDRTETAPARPATLTFLDNQRQPVTLPLMLNVRGNFRRSRTNCSFPPLLIDFLQMATVAVFEYMIGNTDWSVPYLHNIRLLDNGRTHTLPVPYDFDHAGIVDAGYARPPEQLGLQSVRERICRGLVYPTPVFQRVFDLFNRVKSEFYALYQTDNRLDKAYVKRTLKYLDEFYAVISKPTSAVALFAADVGK